MPHDNDGIKSLFLKKLLFHFFFIEVGGQEWQHSLLHFLGFFLILLSQKLAQFKWKTPVKDIEGDSFGSLEG